GFWHGWCGGVGLAGVGFGEGGGQVGGLVGGEYGEAAEVGGVRSVPGPVVIAGAGGAVGGDVDGVAVGPVAEQDAVDVQALALDEQGGDAGACVRGGGIGDQRQGWDGVGEGVGVAEGGDG